MGGKPKAVAAPRGELYHRPLMTDGPTRAANFSQAGVYFSQDANDRDLVTRCLAGDQSAFEPLVERYHRVLFTVAVRILGDREAAADAAQNAFISAYRKLGTFDPQRRFFSWLYRILVNECLNDRRSRRSHEPLSPGLAVVDSPADLLEASERRRRVQTAILSLSPEYREVVVLRHFTGLSYEEISDALGVPAKTVKSRLHTARQRLGHLLLGEDVRK
jgi:RNA polymerase sigma-70 factor, ECF subfamily